MHVHTNYKDKRYEIRHAFSDAYSSSTNKHSHGINTGKQKCTLGFINDWACFVFEQASISHKANVH